MRWLRELGAALTTMALVVAAFWPSLSLLVDGHGWWPQALTVVAITASAGALSRLLLRRTWPGWLLALVVNSSIVLVMSVPSSQRSGPLPNSDTWAGLQSAADQLVSSITNDVAPVRPIPEITAAVTLLVALAALAVEACTRGVLPLTKRRRIPATAVPILLLPMLATSFVVDHPVGAGVLASTLAAALAALLVPVRGPAEPAPAVGHSAGRPSGRGAWPRVGSVTGSAAAAAVAAAITVLIAPGLLVPNPATGAFPVGSRWISPGASSGVDPFLDLSRDLRSPLSKDIVTYAVSGDQDPYLRTSVVSDLFAPTWGPSNRRSRVYAEGSPLEYADRNDYEEFPFPDGSEMEGTGYDPALFYSVSTQDGPTEASDERVGIDAHDYASPWLLLPQGAYSTTGLPAPYRSYFGTSTLKNMSERSVKGGRYTVELAEVPQTERLREAESMDEVRAEYERFATDGLPDLDEPGVVNDEGYVEDEYGDQWRPEDIEQMLLPGRRDREDMDKIPDSVREAADDAVSGTASADSPYEVAQALRAYLRGGDFVYSESAPIRSDGKTGGVSMVESFLSEKSGYCVHFASAMALMARAEGIPARIAVGYTPGTSDGEGEVAGVSGTVREVNSRQAHAWAELYFVGVGWVPFDATPGFAGTEVDRAIAADTTSDTPAVDDPVAGRGQQSATASESAETESSSATVAPSTATTDASSNQGGTRGHWGWWVAAAAILVSVPGIMWLSRRLPEYVRRWRSRRILRGGDEAARRAWVEVARLAGVTGSEVWATPAPAAASAWFPSDAAAARLAAAVDRERYASGAQRLQDPQALLEDLRLVREAAENRASGRSH